APLFLLLGLDFERFFSALQSSGWLFFINNSTFANGEVKEFKEVREVKAICFIAKYTTKKAIGYDF
uniref:hypothetical protein n=1 Tax=Prevotella sp. TaxID=59823 RepID=UPI0027E358F6